MEKMTSSRPIAHLFHALCCFYAFQRRRKESGQDGNLAISFCFSCQWTIAFQWHLGFPFVCNHALLLKLYLNGCHGTQSLYSDKTVRFSFLYIALNLHSMLCHSVVYNIFGFYFYFLDQQAQTQLAKTFEHDRA